jgi:hypothetical protein
MWKNYKEREGSGIMEKAYEIKLISVSVCKDGRHFIDLNCIAEDGSQITVVLPASNLCEEMPFRDSHRCNECEYSETCEIMAPYEIELGRKLIIVEN